MRIDPPPNPRQSLCKAVDLNVLTVDEGKQIEAWLDRIEPQMREPETTVFLHNDLHPWNLMIDPETLELAAILDWGDAGIGDPAKEFCSMPILALPEMVAGFEEAGGTWTEDMALRAQLYGIELALWEIRSLEVLAFERNWWRMPVDGWRGIIED